MLVIRSFSGATCMSVWLYVDVRMCGCVGVGVFAVLHVYVID